MQILVPGAGHSAAVTSQGAAQNDSSAADLLNGKALQGKQPPSLSSLATSAVTDSNERASASSDAKSGKLGKLQRLETVPETYRLPNMIGLLPCL